MGLRPGSVVGLSPLSGEAGQPAQRLSQHLGLLAEGEADVAAGRFGVVVEDLPITAPRLSDLLDDGTPVVPVE